MSTSFFAFQRSLIGRAEAERAIAGMVAWSSRVTACLALRYDVNFSCKMQERLK